MNLFAVIDSASVSDGTKKNYRNLLHGLIHVAGDIDLVTALGNVKGFLEALWKMVGVKNRAGFVRVKDYLKLILALAKHSQEFASLIPLDQWRNEFNLVNEKVLEFYSRNTPSLRQQLGYIPFEKLVEIRDGLKRGSLERLLLMMYTVIPPARNDYWRCQIVTPGQEVLSDNYLELGKNGARLILRKYKTSRTYGTLETELPRELFEEINLSLSIQPRIWLFARKDGEAYASSNSFNSWANRTLQRVTNNEFITLTILRNIFVNRSDLRLVECSIVERKEVAKRMGHSWVDQQQYYSWHACTNLEEKNQPGGEAEGRGVQSVVK